METHYMLLELKLLSYLFFFNLALVILQPILLLLSKVWSRAATLEQKLRRYLYWNGLIRFFIEVYLDFTLLAFINLRDFEWDSSFSSVTFCNLLAVNVVIAISVLPIALISFFLCKKSAAWKEEKFQERYGSFLDGTNLEMKDSE